MGAFMSGSISAGLGSQAAPITFEWRGKEHTIGNLEWGSVISALEQWLVDRALQFKMKAWKPLMDMGVLTPEQLADRCEKFIDECNNEGSYSFGSEPMMRIMDAAGKGTAEKKFDPSIFAGVVKLSSLLMNLSEDDAISLMADKEKSLEVMVKLGLAMGRSLSVDKKPEAAPQSTAGF